MENSIILSNDFHSILPNLLLGSLSGAEYIVREKKADYIISFLSKNGPHYPQFEELMKVCDIERTYLGIDDAQDVDITPYLDQITDLIDSLLGAKKIVYVHCYMGISRSASFIIAYLIKYKHMTYDQARDFVGSRRDCINPNRRFVKDLKEWEKRIKGINSI